MCSFITIFAWTLALLGDGGQVNPDGEVIQILRRAGEVAETLPVDDLSPRYRILYRIACLQAAVGDEEGAARTAEEVVKSDNEPVAFHPRTRNNLNQAMFNAVLVVKMKRGDLKAAEDLRAQARKRATDPIQNSRGSGVRDLTGTAEWQAKAGDFEGAAASARRAQAEAETLPISVTKEQAERGRPWSRPLAFLVVARALDFADEGQAANRLRERAITDVKAIANQEEREEALGKLINERAELGDRAGALAWLDASPEVLHPKPNAWIVGFVIGYADGDVDLALRLVDRVTDSSNRVTAIAGVARHLSTSGRWREAATVWARITPPVGDVTAPSRVFLVDLAYAQARAGDRDATLVTARRALAAAEHPGFITFAAFVLDSDLKHRFPATSDYTRLAVSFWLVGEREQAANLMCKAQAMADAMHDNPPGASGMAYIFAEAEADMRNYDATIQTLQQVQFPDVHFVRRIVQSGIEMQLKAGEVAAASRLLDALIRAPNGEREAAELVEAAANRIAEAGDIALGLRWTDAQTSAERKVLALLRAVSYSA